MSLIDREYIDALVYGLAVDRIKSTEYYGKSFTDILKEQKEDTVKLEEKIAVHCPTKELAKRVCEKSGHEFNLSNWDTYKENTHLNLAHGKKFNHFGNHKTYPDREFYVDKVISAKEYLQEDTMYNKAEQEALEKSIRKHERIVEWLRGKSYDYLVTGKFKSVYAKEVFDDNDPGCALCGYIGVFGVDQRCRTQCILGKSFGDCGNNAYKSSLSCKDGLEWLEAEEKLLEQLKSCRVEEPQPQIVQKKVIIENAKFFTSSIYRDINIAISDKLEIRNGNIPVDKHIRMTLEWEGEE